MTNATRPRTVAAALLGACIGGGAAAQSFELEPRIGFPDFRFMVPPGPFADQVFVLSDEYPDQLPDLDPAVQEILQIDFRTDPLAYVMAVRDYIFDGNIRGGSVDGDFIFQENTAGLDWYHVPWQHWGPLGREGHHGLTREGPLGAHTLAPSQNQTSSAYAVGFYNGPGGFAIGRVWPSPDEGPDLSSMIAGEGFPEGTVVGKFLFTVLGDDQVPWLANPLQWRAYVYECDIPTAEPCPQDLTGDEPHLTQRVNLLQMDIMVKDGRAGEAADWVFGTFAYNGTLPDGHAYSDACADIEGDGRKWCNLMPVGVMWGNDPDVRDVAFNDAPTETIVNDDLEETWINRDPDLPAMHLGFNSRLNGPADNPTSSCMSCHSTGQYPVVSAIMPWLNHPPVPIPEEDTEASDEWMRWFRNFRDGEAFDEGRAISMDFSMQLAKSVENYVEYRSQSQQGLYALEYWGRGEDYDIMRGALPPAQ